MKRLRIEVQKVVNTDGLEIDHDVTVYDEQHRADECREFIFSHGRNMETREQAMELAYWYALRYSDNSYIVDREVMDFSTGRTNNG